MDLMKKEIDYQIQARDVDAFDVIKPLAIIDIFQDIASTHATELGIGYQVLKERGYAWIVLYQEFEIKIIPAFAEKVKIISWPKPKGRLEFERELLITNEAGETLIQGIAKWLVIELATHKLIKSSEIDFPGDYIQFTNYPEKCRRKLDLQKDLIEDYFTYQIQYDDLDHNGHMNNAKYISILFNHYPLYQNHQYIYQVKIAYIKEAKYQEVLKIGHYSMEKGEAYLAYLGDELCFECVIGVKKL